MGDEFKLVTTVNINKSTGFQELKTIIQKKVCYTSFIKHPYTHAICGITTDAQLHISIPGICNKLVNLDDIFWKDNIYIHASRFPYSDITYEYIVHHMSFCTNGNPDILGISITANVIVNGKNMSHMSYDNLERGVSIVGIIRINTADPEMPLNLNYIDYKRLLSCIMGKISVPFVWLSEDIIYIDKGIAVLSSMTGAKSSLFTIEHGYANLPEPIKKILKPLLDLDPLTATIVKCIASAIVRRHNFIGYDIYCPKDLNSGATYLYHVDENRVFCYMLSDVFERIPIPVKSDHAKYRIKEISYENKLMAISSHGQLTVYTEGYSYDSKLKKLPTWSLSIYNLQEEIVNTEKILYLTQINQFHLPSVDSTDNEGNTTIPLIKTMQYDADNKLWLLNTNGELLQLNLCGDIPILDLKQTNVYWLTKCENDILICSENS